GTDIDGDPQRAELCRTLPLMSRANGITDGKKVFFALTLIAASARGAPEQCYLPAELAQVLHQPWTPADTWMVLDPRLKTQAAGGKRGAGLASMSGQGPCPCGSGRKYKRCCGT